MSHRSVSYLRSAAGRSLFAPLLLLLATWVLADSAAALTLAIDLDIATPGIQSTRTVGLGQSFAVDVVLVGDGVTLFDEVILDIGYNDGVPVLVSGPGSVVALDLISTVAMAWDVTVPTVGPPLGPPPAALVPLGFAPSLPYLSSEGGFGYYTFPGDFPVVGAGVEITVAGTTLTGVAPGSSTVAPLASPGGALFLGSFPIPATLVGATVTVPEPSLGALLLLGWLAGRAAQRRR